MTTLLIVSGGLVSKDPDASQVFTLDWDLNSLAVGVTITASTWLITAISPSQTDAVLTYDNAARLTAAQATAAVGRTVAADNRVTQVRLLAGTPGQRYEIENTITTSETPAQIKIGRFVVLVED